MVDGLKLKEVVQIQQECEEGDEDDCSITTLTWHVPSKVCEKYDLDFIYK